MATSSVSGKAGIITGLPGVTEITRWTINIAMDTPDATSVASSGWKEVVAGLQSASGSIQAKGIELPPIDAARVTLVFSEAASSPTITLTIGAFLSNVQVEGDVEGIWTFSADFIADGSAVVS